MSTPFSSEIAELCASLPNAVGWGDILTIGDVFAYQRSRQEDIAEMERFFESDVKELRELSGLPLLDTDRYPLSNVSSAVRIMNGLKRGHRIAMRTYKFEVELIDAWLLRHGLRSSY